MAVAVSKDFIKRYYAWGVIRLAALSVNGEMRLIAAHIDLLPHEYPQPSSSKRESYKFDKKTGSYLYFEQVALTASDAVEWYKTAEITLENPVALESSLANKKSSVIHCGEFEEMPAWPLLSRYGDYIEGAFAEERELGRLPFISDRQNEVYIHRKLSVDLTLNAVLKENAIEWLKCRLFVNFMEFPELLGGMVLVLHNPKIREHHCKLDRVSRNHESVNITLQSRVNCTTENMQICYRAGDGHGVVDSGAATIDTSPRTNVGDIQRIDQISYDVIDPELGSILHSPMAPFIRSFQIDTHTKSNTTRITAPESRKASAEPETWDVEEYSPAREVNKEGEQKLSVRDNLRRAASLRGSRKRSTQQDFKWMDDPKKGRALIREKISAGRKQVAFYDPYFGVPDLNQPSANEFVWFGYNVAKQVDLLMVTSDNIFQSSISLDPDERNKRQQEDNKRITRLNKLDLVNQEFIKLKEKRTGSDTRLYVMRNLNGGSELHDRFLQVDSSIWMSGHSFGSLGQRKGSFIRLPDPNYVEEKLNEILQGSVLWSDFYTSKKTEWTIQDD